MTIPDGKIEILSPLGSVINVSVPEYGYKSIIEFPFDIQKLDNGRTSTKDYGYLYDKYRCECKLILNQYDQNKLNSMIETTERANYSYLTLEMNEDSGFFPFTPLRGDVGKFSAYIEFSEHDRVLQTPLGYFECGLRIHKQLSWPTYTIPADTTNEGGLQIGTIQNLRFPPNWFNPSEDVGVLLAFTEDGSVQLIDRGYLRDQFHTSIVLRCGKVKAANLLNYIVNTARGGDMALATPTGSYAFGERNGSGSSGPYTIRLNQDNLEITHVDFNQFDIPLNFIHSDWEA